MDRSMDSIGSCSLDVDAESSDISDTSGSLNFPTPISIKDITREFTNNIRERCSVQTVKNTTAYVDPVTGQVCIALTQAPATAINTRTSGILDNSHNQQKTNISKKTPTLLSPQTPEGTYDKKPSYLNLACCVNGYSNITTYDSKIRQDINKSREVSPIRPSSSSLQYCKKSNSLAPPVLLTMPNVNLPSPHQMTTTANGVFVTSATIGSRYSIIENNGYSQNGVDIHNSSNEGNGGGGSSNVRSFIQQRVERLYGPGALAQGFYSPKKIKSSSVSLNKSDVKENGEIGNGGSELARKFQELSPSKDYNQFRKKLSNGKSPISPNNFATKDDIVKGDNSSVDLPCLRHLSQEFRDKLPVISPKRNFSRLSPGREAIQTQTHTIAIPTNGTDNTQSTTVTQTAGKQFEAKIQQNNHQYHHHQPQTATTASASSSSLSSSMLIPSSAITGQDELDHKMAVDDISALEKLVPAIDEPKVVLPTKAPQKSVSNITSGNVESVQPTTATNGLGLAKSGLKDAHFFLRQLKDEQNRLLIMAAEAEKYLDALASNPDITEDTLGLLRSASGKARLLVSQKMKQFEGLCHNNLNSSPEDQFPTTVDDLQGFWDMVYLQVDHVDSIFADIEKLKKNDWKKPLELQPPAVSVVRTPRGNKPLSNSKSKSSTTMTNGAGQSATPTAAALKREAQRKKLQEMKRRNREAMAAASAGAGAGADADASSTTNESPSTIEIESVKSVTNAVLQKRQEDR